MIYRHRATGKLYRKLIDSFDVSTQRTSRVYVSLEEGQVFNRDLEDFRVKFDLLHDSQSNIVPKEPHT